MKAEYRITIGQWEGDRVTGKDRRYFILTLVDRKFGYLILKKLQARTIEEVNKACDTALSEHAASFKTITFDNGTEFHGYKLIGEGNLFGHPSAFVTFRL